MYMQIKTQISTFFMTVLYTGPHPTNLPSPPTHPLPRSEMKNEEYLSGGRGRLQTPPQQTPVFFFYVEYLYNWPLLLLRRSPNSLPFS